MAEPVPRQHLVRRVRRGLVLAAVVVGAVVAYSLHTSSAPTAAPRQVATVGFGDVDVTVGGVGRIVTAGATSPTTSASSGAASAASSTGGGAAPVPPDSVFARMSGSVARLLVRSGDTVTAGQPIALLDDAGAAEAAVRQAEQDLQTARIGLSRDLRPLTPADVSALRLDVRRAQADLETLLGGTARDRRRAQRLARRTVQQAQRRLDLVLHPRNAADVAAAQADVRNAEADLDALTTPPPPATAAALAAARSAVDAGRARLAKLTGPPDPTTVTAARADVAKADADLALILQQDPPATAAEITLARAVRDAAQARLDQLLGPPDPAEVAAAQAELRKAEADLAALQAPAVPPSAAALAASRQVVAAARAKLAAARRPAPPADITAGRLELERARADLQALRAGPPPAALTAARAQVVSTRARLAAPPNPLDVDAARVGVDAAGARLSAARAAAALLTVRAVQDGTVTDVLARRGSLVDTLTPVATISDLGHLAVDVDVSEFDTAQVRLGMTAAVSVDALGGKTFPGTVVFASPVGSDASGVVTFPVRVRLAGASGLKAGMNVSVRILVDQRRHVIKIPLEAVFDAKGGRQRVTVLDRERLTRRTVELGLADNKAVEVVDGLRAGERVVLAATGGGGE